MTAAKKKTTAKKAKTGKHPGGRPSEYSPKYCKSVIEWGRKGLAPVQWAAKLLVAKNTLIEWGKKHPEFRDAYAIGMDLREAWLVSQANNRTTGRNKWGSDAMIKFMLAANHGYRDKVDVELSGELETTSTVEVSFATLLTPTHMQQKEQV